MSSAALRASWVLLGVLSFALGWACTGALGEVVGEAWGGDFLHAIGHALGTVVLMALVSLGGMVALRDRVAWASRWVAAATLGALLGFLVFLPVLAFAPESMAGLNLALTLHLPLASAAAAQGWALRGHVCHPVRWAVAWYLAVLCGVAVAWFAGGGLAGADADSVHPVLPKALEYWWRMMPRSLLGGVAYAVATAALLWRARLGRRQGRSTPRRYE